MRATGSRQGWKARIAGAVLIAATTGFCAEPPHPADGKRPPKVTLAAVDLIELNHYRTDPRHEFTAQYIFWRRCRTTGEMLPVAWHSGNAFLEPTAIRSPDRRRGRLRWSAAWRAHGVSREVSAPSFRESWTEFDPESECRPLLMARGIRQNTIFPDEAAHRFLGDDAGPPVDIPEAPGR